MKIDVLQIQNTYVPEFWWMNVMTKVINCDTWIDHDLLNDDEEYFEHHIDPDYEAEKMMNNYERLS